MAALLLKLRHVVTQQDQNTITVYKMGDIATTQQREITDTTKILAIEAIPNPMEQFEELVALQQGQNWQNNNKIKCT